MATIGGEAAVVLVGLEGAAAVVVALVASEVVADSAEVVPVEAGNVAYT